MPSCLGPTWFSRHAARVDDCTRCGALTGPSGITQLAGFEGVEVEEGLVGIYSSARTSKDVTKDDDVGRKIVQVGIRRRRYCKKTLACLV